MKHAGVLIVLLILSLPLAAQSLSAGAAILFRDSKTKMSNAEKNKVFKDVALEVAPGNKALQTMDIPVTASVYATDMNTDGREEVFVLMSSSAFGAAGADFRIFMKDASGTYKMLDIGGGLPAILAAKNQGMNDILIGGPGFEYPVYRWNGRSYQFHKTVADAEYGRLSPLDVAAFSKRYTDRRP